MVLAGLVAGSAAQAVQLRMKYVKDQEQTNKTDVNLTGKLEVEGSQRLSGNASGKCGVSMSQKAIETDDKGGANLEMRLSNLNVTMDSEADWGEGKKTYSLKLDENGGTMTDNGKAEPIPPLPDVKSQSWQVKMNSLGAPEAFDLDSSQMGTQEAEDVKKMSQSIAGIVSKSSPLPEKDVKAGDTWETVLSVKDLTNSLAKDNPMLGVVTDLGIPDVKTSSTLKELRQEAGNEIAVINSTTNLIWKDGNIPLGPVNLTLKSLEVKSESITEMNNTKGMIPRTTTVTTLDFEIVVNSAVGSEGPSTYNAKGSLKLESVITIN